jgi:hypothetical protein
MADDGRVEKALERVRSARADYEAKQDDVQTARERYYDAVRALNQTGMSLREVAEALGLSHQRVHQMVGESADSSTKLLRAARKAAKAGGALLLVLAVATGVGVLVDEFLINSKPVIAASPAITASVSPRAASNSANGRTGSSHVRRVHRRLKNVLIQIVCRRDDTRCPPLHGANIDVHVTNGSFMRFSPSRS